MRYFFHLLLFFVSTHSFAQECDDQIKKKHWNYRVNLSTFIAIKEGVDINPKYIYYDFMDLPIGVPFNYLDYINIKGYKYVDIDKNKLLEPAFHSYQEMRSKALRDGININIRSSYRNKSTQEYVFHKHGPKVAENPGYSEHHLLTTMDIHYCGENTKLFLWMLKYGADYGWIPTYFFRTGSYIRKESWHWRYVGADAAYWFRCTWNYQYQSEINRLQAVFGHI
ncbi:MULTISPECIES: M15 family metallopeptidase [Flammeovirga]|uniref:M15 family metallopeptidase n=1 Tax=Flammeovirga agarivorans TaxID=2726742 RepID=A0A7X8SKZ5_9BACT|nr:MULTISPECIES: D-alanyl-D-alanine carboxypeptidase family protein [Flammeovirga]NLR92065.1 M15 family metallopeptidase [Flammeovirga agarivorans]